MIAIVEPLTINVITLRQLRNKLIVVSIHYFHRCKLQFLTKNRTVHAQATSQARSFSAD